MSKHITDIKVSNLANSEVEITGSITREFIEECRAEAIKELNKKVNLPGFRPGHIPEDTLIKRVGEGSILEEAAEIALAREFTNIIKESKAATIGRPNVSITKIAPGIPLEFKITSAIEPKFELPDYKKLAKDASIEKKVEPVTEKEVDDVKEEIKRQGITPELKEGENLEEKIKENIIKEKEFRLKEKNRLSIIEALIKETKMEIPQVLVDAELEKMVGTFKDDVVRAGLKWEDYLKSIKKTESEVREEWKEKAGDRAKAELIVMKIAEDEKIEPVIEELEREIEHLQSHYSDADPFKLRMYLYTMMRNEKVFEYLESLK
jgi:FKBP-type peptidyl-prolyl cis-trans isomerase (trigger factor)